jgi:2-keto-4-pentenoate hydratase
MLDTDQIEAASTLLCRAWAEGRPIDALPDGLRPTSRAEGYAIQALVERLSTAPLYGWKIAATSAAGQAHIGVDGPLAGRLLAERAVASGAELSLAGNRMRVAEPELAFRIGRTLAPRAAAWTVAEVMTAVEGLHPAIEIPDSRFADFVTAGAPQLIADNACAHQLVLGPAAPASWREFDLAAHPVRARVGDGAWRHGGGANVLGDPRLALTWLANELSGLGLPLRAGQIVTSGTCMTPLAIAAGDTVEADFGRLGAVRLRLAA